jgi:hypothetical protein
MTTKTKDDVNEEVALRLKRAILMRKLSAEILAHIHNRVYGEDGVEAEPEYADLTADIVVGTLIGSIMSVTSGHDCDIPMVREAFNRAMDIVEAKEKEEVESEMSVKYDNTTNNKLH